MVRPTRWNTRYFSNKQEKKVAKAVGGKQTPNSGAVKFVKGDVLSDKFLLECKTCTEPRKQMSVKLDWIKKNEEEAFAMNKPYSAVVIDFGQSDNYYIIDEKLFQQLLEKVEEE